VGGGFPIKDFGNDRTDNEGASPLITPGKDENTKRQRKKIKNNPEEKASVSSPLNGSIAPFSSPLNASIVPLSVIPEWFYQESKLFKGKSLWIPTSSSPRQSSSRGPQSTVFENQRKKQKLGCLIKDFRHDGRGVIPECLYHPVVRHS